MAELSDAATRLFEYLPATYGATPEDLDPLVARWLEGLAFEIERIRTMLLALRSTMIPGVADDSFGGLAAWEGELGLPVRPPDASEGQRRAAVRAALRGRLVASGRQWSDAMDAAVGAGRWSVQRNTPLPEHLEVTIPFEEGSYSAGQVEQLVRRRSPATQIIVMRYEAGFLVGISRVGDAL